MQEALGIIETVGFATAVQASDAAVKAANVKLCDLVKIGGGRMDVIFRGDVAAVKASIEAGAAAAAQVGKVMGQTVIPRPADKLSQVFPIEPRKPIKT
jgi:ethanolamine utilization protein EutM